MAVSAMPATAVGRANGKSISAAISAVPKLKRIAASTRGSLAISHQPCGPSPAAFISKASSGNSTIRPSQPRVMPSVRPNPGKGPACRQRRARASVIGGGSSSGLVDLVEQSAVAEVHGLRILPTLEGRVDGDGGEGGELRELGSGHEVRARWAEVVARCKLLSARAVEELQVGLGDLAGAVAIDILVHQRDRWLGQDADAGNHDLEIP